jgi:hypothetical protein
MTFDLYISIEMLSDTLNTSHRETENISSHLMLAGNAGIPARLTHFFSPDCECLTLIGFRGKRFAKYTHVIDFLLFSMHCWF